jgi:hypothetical protein
MQQKKCRKKTDCVWYNTYISGLILKGEEEMRRVIITIGLVALFSPCMPVRAELIKIGLAGQVDYIDDPYSLLENGVHQGDSITGFYIYDSETPDSDPSIYIGFYQHWTAPYGMSLTAGSLTFQTDPTNVNLEIGLTNNYEGDPPDHYTVTGHNNLALANGVSIDNLHWQLDDYSGTALSNDALPLTAPDLSRWQSNSLSVSGGMYPFPLEGDKTLFRISGQVTSVWLIPEPASLLIFGLGGILLRKRS